MDDVPRYWAVLIGINFYRNPQHRLRGCLRDVKNLQDFLQEPQQSTVDLQVFTAETPSDLHGLNPVGPPERWPTFANVTSSLEKIITQAKPRDYVYVHFSGHGTRIPYSPQDQSTGDLALDLFDERYGLRYLRGAKLTQLLGDMVEKGLLVTLVLDCCFSGSVARHDGLSRDTTVRCIKYDPSIDAAYPEKDTEGVKFPAASSLRDAQMVPQWLINPSGYTILTACGPHEKAHEIKFDNEERNGALSYFLYNALVSLRKSRVEISHQSLHQNMCARFHAEFPQQNPMRFGESTLTFFGKIRTEHDHNFVPIYESKKTHELWLSAGHAHGVSEQDEYAAFPFELSETVRDLEVESPVIVKVTTVYGLKSRIFCVENQSSPQVKTGWKARALTHISLQKIPVRVVDPAIEKNSRIIGPRLTRFMRFVDPGDISSPCLFSVFINRQKEFEIRDQSGQKIPGLPTVSLNRDDGIEDILRILDHACAYKFIESIENRIPPSDLENSLEINFTGSSDQGFSESGILRAGHGERIGFQVRNTSDQELYMYVYDLKPEWWISSLISESGGGDHLIIGPKKEFKGELKMEVPDSFMNRGCWYCEDVIKIFFTRRQSSFAPLLMPRIDDLNKPVQEGSRQLAGFLSKLAVPSRSASDQTSDEEWTVRNYVIRTECK